MKKFLTGERKARGVFCTNFFPNVRNLAIKRAEK